MKSTTAIAIGSVSALACGMASAQSTTMMNGGGMWGSGGRGGYGGYLGPLLLVVVIGVIFWVVLQKRK
jgi:hypothetical protein